MTQLVLIEGFVATGKSTLAGMLAKKLGFPRIDVDVVMGRLLLSKAWGEPGYQPSRETHDVVATLAVEIVRSGCSLILEAGNFEPWLWPRLTRLLASGVALNVISFQTHSPLEVCAERAQMRKEKHPRIHGIGRDECLALEPRWTAQEAYERDGLIHLDTTLPLNLTLKKMLQIIHEGGCSDDSTPINGLQVEVRGVG